MSDISITDLTASYLELIDLDPAQQDLLSSAIDRAVDARNIIGGQKGVQRVNLIAGGISAPTPHNPNPNPCSHPPVLINGIIAVDPNCPPQKHPVKGPYSPDFFPIGKIANPKS
jgi:hypothetical protein